MNPTTLGIDLAKNSFSLHGVDAKGNVVLRKTLSRSKLLEFISQLPPCTIGMEACSGAHHWARHCQTIGHRARIMAPRFVAPYRKGGKNDGNDAEAICEAVARPSMRFVPVKSEEQQAILCLHRIRQAQLPDILEDADNGLPALARRLLSDVHQRLRELNQDLLAYDRELEHLAKTSDSARRLMGIPGIGATTATALLASIGDPGQFHNGRQLAAWLGLVPRQYTTGGVIRLGRITKQGDKYLRTLLIHGTRAVLATVAEKTDKLSVWIKQLIERRGYKRACVALAAKNARIVWALLTQHGEYQRKAA